MSFWRAFWTAWMCGWAAYDAVMWKKTDSWIQFGGLVSMLALAILFSWIWKREDEFKARWRESCW